MWSTNELHTKEEGNGDIDTTPVRIRKLWIDSKPFTPPSQNLPDHTAPVILKLTHFAKKAVIDFGECKVNHTAVRKLSIENANLTDVDVAIERFPYKKNFCISKRIFTIEPEATEVVTISWAPRDAGNCRELVTVNYEGFRIQFIMLGTALPIKLVSKRRKRPLRPTTSTVTQSCSVENDKENKENLSRHRKPPLLKPSLSNGGGSLKQPFTDLKTTQSNNKGNQDSIENNYCLHESSGPKSPPLKEVSNFEHFDLKGHLQQSLDIGRPTFLVSQTPPSELPAYLSTNKEISSSSVHCLAKPTVLLPLPEKSNLEAINITDSLDSPFAFEGQVTQLEKNDCLIQEFHERVISRNTPDNALVDSLENCKLPEDENNLDASLLSNTSTATYVLVEPPEHSVQQNDVKPLKRKSDHSVTRVKKSPKMEKLQRRKSSTTPRKFKVYGNKKSGTPKGKAIQKLRAAKTGNSFHSPRKLSSQKNIPKNLPANSDNRTKSKISLVDKTPTVAGIKRGKLISAKKPTKAKPVKGIPMAHLVLASDSKPIQRRHPSTFASRNQFYDAKWKEKQEKAFMSWINYVFTPDEFKAMESTKKSVSSSLLLVTNANVEPAMSKEAASLRAYKLGCRLNDLRRAACAMFLSDSMSKIIHKVEEVIDTGCIKLRNDKHVWKDLGSRGKLLELLMNFHTLWLRIGLETVFGETVPIFNNEPETSISRFIVQRVLFDSEIAKSYLHPTVPHSYRPGFEEELGKHILKKLLVLIYVLDQAKQARLIDHDPCLFRKGAGSTSCREILTTVSREFLKGEGDIVKHLSYLGYSVSHQQSYLDEFEYGVHNLASDLRDGIRLTRLTEILFCEWSLSKKMRVPPGSILQKRHNTGVAMTALEKFGISMKDDSGKLIEADHIVKGNREKTLSLVWNLAVHFQLVGAVNQEQIREEIRFLKKTLILKNAQTGDALPNLSGDLDSIPDNNQVEKTSLLLLNWCKYVCAHRGIEVHNFVGSFSDGRVLANLISYYQPQLIPPAQIKMQTTLDMGSNSLGVPETTSNETYTQLCKNEKFNFIMVKKAAYELGGIPSLLSVEDFCGTVPDSKVVRLFVAYLCARLIDVRVEDRAARILQITWRLYRAKCLEHEKRETAAKFQQTAAVTLTTAIRGWLIRKRYQRILAACQKIQLFCRSYKQTRAERRSFLLKRCAAIKIQSFVRMILTRSRVKISRKEQEVLKLQVAAVRVIQRNWRRKLQLKERNLAAVQVQSVYRGFKTRQQYQKIRNATKVIQQEFRAFIAKRSQRNTYIQLQRIVLYLQTRVRQKQARKHFVKIKNACIKVQSSYRGYKDKQNYLTLKKSVVIIQSWFRCVKARNDFLLLKNQTMFLQQKWKATLECRNTRQSYQELREAAVAIQKYRRGYVQRKKFLDIKTSARLLQSKWRSYKEAFHCRKYFCDLRQVAIKLQAIYRGNVARKNYSIIKETKRKCIAATLIQSCFRGYVQKSRYNAKCHACVLIQSWYRGRIERQKYINTVKATKIVQGVWRSLLVGRPVRKNYLHLRQTAIKLQAMRKGAVARRRFLTMQEAAVCIQSNFKCWIAKKYYHAIKHSVIRIQAWYRCVVVRRYYSALRCSVICLQQHWKATLVARCHQMEYLCMKTAATNMQAIHRGCLQRQKFIILKKAAIRIQIQWRSFLLTRQFRVYYTNLKRSVLKIQSFYRCYLAAKLLRELKEKKMEEESRLWAATIIQAEWKRYREQCNFASMKHATVTVQAWFKSIMQRREFLAKKNSSLVLQERWRATLLCRRERNVFLRSRFCAIQIQSARRCVVQRRQFLCMRNAAVTIQSVAKACSTRKKYIQKRNAAIKIQACYRRFVAVQKYQTKRNAVNVIKAHWKALCLGREVQNHFVLMRLSVIKIQSYYRGSCKRYMFLKQKSAAITIQRRWRATANARDCRSYFVRLRCATIKIQSCIRRHLAKLKYQSFLAAHLQQLKRNKAATIIQSLFMGRRDRNYFIKVKHSVVKIQSCWRSFIQRRKYLALLSSAGVIQGHWRATLLSRICRTYFLRLRHSCITIQSVYRMHLAQLQHKKLLKASVETKRRKNAAIAIQSCWRGKKERRKFAQLKHHAIKIQSWYKSNCARRVFLNQKSAAVVIQRKWKATRMTTLCRSYFLHLRRSCIKIQSTFRRHQAIIELKELKQAKQAHLNNTSATLIQSVWKGYRTKKVFLQQRAAAITIQSWSRRIFARRNFLKAKTSAIIIQQHWRATKLTSKCRANYLKIVAATATIQSAFRRHLVKLQYQKLVKKNIAALRIQAFWKGWLERKQYIKKINCVIRLQTLWRLQLAQRAFLLKRSSAVTIQSWWKGYVQRQNFLCLRTAVLVVQRRWRATRLGSQCRLFFLQLKQATLTIQLSFRRHLCQLQYDKIKRTEKLQQQNKCATIIQANWKMWLNRNRFIYKLKCIVKIQSWYRGARQKKKFTKQKSSAVAIQIRWRATKLALQCRSDFLQLTSATVLIQSSYRRHLAIKKYLKLKEAYIEKMKIYSAVICIQSSWKGWQARKLFLQKRKSAVCIQAWFKGAIQKHSYASLKNAAAKIQQRWKETILSRDIRRQFVMLRSTVTQLQAKRRGLACRKNYLKMKLATTAIQAQFRSWVSRKHYILLKDSSIVIQSWFRCSTRRKAFLTQRKAALCIQSYWRAQKLSEQIRSRFVLTRKAAVTIQAFTRCRLQRRKFQKVKLASFTIQQHWHATLAARRERNCYLSAKNNIVILQAHFRRYLAQKSFNELVQIKLSHEKDIKAAVLIQSFWRMVKQKQQFCQMRFSAITIQSKFRSWRTKQVFLTIKCSTITIQKQWRATIACRRQRSKYLEMRRQLMKECNAAVTIQKVFKGWKAKRSFQVLLEKKAAKRKLQLLMISMAAKDHLAAITLQRAYRKYILLRDWRKLTDKVAAIQRWWRAKLIRMRYLKLLKSAIFIQQVARRHFEQKKAASIVIQTWYRVCLAKKYALRRRNAILAIQTCWRGYRVRRSMQLFPGIAFHRTRIQEATKRASLHPENKIRSRTTRALKILFNQKYFQQILNALRELEIVSSILEDCCERIALEGGPEALMNLVTSCSRDFGSMSVIKHSMKILSNLLKNPKAKPSTIDTLGRYLEALVDLVSNYQDRGFRDRGTRPVFNLACHVIFVYMDDCQSKKMCPDINPMIVQRLQYILKETERRIKKQSESSNLQKKMRDRRSVGYLNDSSLLTESSFVRECSFVKGMYSRMASTSTPDRKQAPKLPDSTKHTMKAGQPVQKPAQKPTIKAPLTTRANKESNRKKETGTKPTQCMGTKSTQHKPLLAKAKPNPNVGATPKDMTKETLDSITRLLKVLNQLE